jgi:type I restriction enzyme S subunit
VDSSDNFYFKDGRVLWIKTARSGFDSEYLRSHLSDLLVKNYNAIASGTAFAELKIVNLKNLIVLRPPLESQAKFSGLVAGIKARLRELKSAERATDSLFASLQHRAFSGQL